MKTTATATNKMQTANNAGETICLHKDKDTNPRFRKSLRNDNINYRNGLFFVTWQTAHNKSIFGAIVGDRCELNELGHRVEEYWREMPAKYPEMELDEFVVMPNHFHAIVRIRFRPTNKEHHLGFLLGRFKGGIGYIYGKMRRAGEVDDIGGHLWQFDYWDKIVKSERNMRKQKDGMSVKIETENVEENEVSAELIW